MTIWRYSPKHPLGTELGPILQNFRSATTNSFQLNKADFPDHFARSYVNVP